MLSLQRGLEKYDASPSRTRKTMLEYKANGGPLAHWPWGLWVGGGPCQELQEFAGKHMKRQDRALSDVIITLNALCCFPCFLLACDSEEVQGSCP